jgi:hypothetical protein
VAWRIETCIRVLQVKVHPAIRALAASADAWEDGESEYGVFLRADGELRGPNGRVLPVTTIWLRWRSDGSVHFLTRKPCPEPAP